MLEFVSTGNWYATGLVAWNLLTGGTVFVQGLNVLGNFGMAKDRTGMSKPGNLTETLGFAGSYLFCFCIGLGKGELGGLAAPDFPVVQCSLEHGLRGFVEPLAFALGEIVLEIGDCAF
jgi:hypothetical protein